MIHKRELSDSMIKSGSSLFYLFHCSAHDRLNTMPFRLFRNTPHGLHLLRAAKAHSPNSLPQHTPHGLHPPLMDGRTSESYFASAHPARIASRAIRAASTISRTLPQHTPHGLHLSPLTLKTRKKDFASAHPARIASAKSHRCNATNPRNML